MLNSELKNFLSRLLSALIFIPIIIIPIISKGFLLCFLYLLLLSFMIFEIRNMSKDANKKILFYLYSFICTFTVFIFIISISAIDDLSIRVIEIILIIWLFDTSCYLGGKILNGRKLIPNISKGKTFNGLYSGVATSLAIGCFYYFQIYNDIFLFISIVIPTLFLSFFGDFFVSILKRSVNTKDTGNIMPGHGGIVDRMDSFILVFFFFGVYQLF